MTTLRHGHARRGASSATYHVWCDMIKRCSVPTHNHWESYGGRGIAVCERWLDFVNFLEDMGEKPPQLSIDRLRVNEGYSKDNCAWATTAQQSRNTRRNIWIEIKGRTQCLTDWCHELGKPIETIRYRARVAGMSWPDALMSPMLKRGGPKKCRVRQDTSAT